MNQHPYGVHHDGSGLYVSSQSPQVGETVQLRLRVHADLSVARVGLRTVLDGEPRVIEAQRTSSHNGIEWWTAEMPVRHHRQNYRWVLHSEGRLLWRNAEGLWSFETADASDYVCVALPLPPAWNLKATVYQIFPDRFARSGRSYDAPDWVVPRQWDERPEGRSPQVGREWFGGDLYGVADHVDYIKESGFSTVYLTPIFPAGSTHRYDAASFAEVDPLLGGNDGLIALRDALSARGMQLVGDITLNHSGNLHPWFTAAAAGDDAFRGFYYFDETLPHGYECWWGFRTLPKFNYASEMLRETLISGTDSVLAGWLRPPYSLDGWRVDVANMTARLATIDMNHDVARLTNQSLRAVTEDAILIAEHCHDASADLDGDGWHGSMAYRTSLRPIWSWLVCDEFMEYDRKSLVPVVRSHGSDMVAAIETVASKMPWRSRCHSWSLLGSHDTARVRSVVGTHERQEAAVGLLIGLPGTPMVFAGDEIGATGLWGEDSRTTMPWGNFTSDQLRTRDMYRELMSLRQQSAALAQGGLRWLGVHDDAVVFARETDSESLIFLCARSAGRFDFDDLGFASCDWQLVFGSANRHANHMEASQAGTTIWRIS